MCCCCSATLSSCGGGGGGGGQALVGVRTAGASATLKVQMVRYENPSSKNYDGSCCDLFCWSQCDHVFTFALDLGNRCVRRSASTKLSDADAVKTATDAGRIVCGNRLCNGTVSVRPSVCPVGR